MYAASLLTAAIFPLWGRNDAAPWTDISISVLPSLMGFSIAALTVLLAFSDSKTLKAITQHGKTNSYFVKTVANLFHFLVVQTIALILAILAKAYVWWILSYFGVLALVYAIFVSIAAAGQLLNTAVIINKAVWTPSPDQSSPSE